MSNLYKCLIIVSVSFVLLGCDNEEKSDRSNLNLTKKVKSVSEYSYEAIKKFGKIEKGERKRRFPLDYDIHYLFNETGNLIEENWFPEIAAGSKIIYHYNNKGVLFEKNRYSTPSGSLFIKYTYDHNDEGHLIEENTYYSDDLFEKRMFEYDRKGNVVEENKFSYREWGSDSIKYVYKYDKNGTKVEMIIYSSDGDLVRKNISLHDKNGNEIEMKEYGPDDGLLSHVTYKYDDKANMIERNCLKSLSRGLSHFNCKTYSFVYEYNDVGDWVMKIEFINGIAEYLIEREIDYFE